VASVMLVALGLFADGMSDRVVTACVGFIAGVQITSLSHFGSWSFNTGMTTGNLLAGVSALAKALTGSAEEWPHAAAQEYFSDGISEDIITDLSKIAG
jgi:uncharacterized membrane protein YoaK (UPF0700 family)